VSWTAVPDQFQSLRERLRNAEREIDRLKGQIAGKAIGDVSGETITIGDFNLLAVQLEVESKEGLRQAGDQLRSTLGSGVLVIGAVVDGKPSVLAMASKDAVEGGLLAGNLIRALVPMIDGKGGGRPDVAEGGGKDASRLPALIASVPGIVETMLAEASARG
jgi:alanyl-tRNA synthetase